MTEWRDIEGYEGYYQVSQDGKVRSVDRIVKRRDGVVQVRKGRIKSLVESTDGYLQVKLSKDAKQKTIGVHILVANAFVSGGGDGLEVNHIDCNRKNNNYQNLEWASHIDNIRHAVKCGTHITKIRSMSGKNNPNFGNKALSAKYAADRALSNEKQSRPGAQNGRAVAVRAMFDEETYRFWLYGRMCRFFNRKWI